MGMFRCAVCDNYADSQDGDCVPMLDDEGNETLDLIHESCATPEELYAYLPGVYPDPKTEQGD